jgi:hypothetical protein
MRRFVLAFGLMSVSGIAADWPDCAQRVSTVPVPDGQHGLFVLLFPGQWNAPFAATLRHTPVICGANIYVVWGQVEKGSDANPRYDWSSVDDQIRPWVEAGKRVNLVVWATGYGRGAPDAMPAHVRASVRKVNCRMTQDVPIFWSREFVGPYQKFMAAVVRKYGGDPNIGYIRFGLSGGGETFPICFFEMNDRYPNFPRIWREYLISMLEYEKTLNSRKLAVGMTPFGPQPNAGHHPNVAALADAAAANGIILGTQGLNSENIHGDCWWCPIFNRHRGQVPLVLQTIAETHPDGARPESLVDLLPFGIRQHAQIFEIYLQDWATAYDRNSRFYPQYHEAYQSALESAARVVGGGR